MQKDFLEQVSELTPAKYLFASAFLSLHRRLDDKISVFNLYHCLYTSSCFPLHLQSIYEQQSLFFFCCCRHLLQYVQGWYVQGSLQDLF